MKTLVILPGWGGTKETWQKFTELAKQDFDVQVINLPCFGDEACPSMAWGVEQYAEFVKNKIFERGMRNEELILLGHSFGGQVAAYFASQNPKMIDKLILFAPALFRRKSPLRRVLFMIAAKFGKMIFKLPFIEKFDVWAKKIFYKTADSPDYNETAGIKREIFKKIIKQDLSAFLPKISTSTLLIQGTMDKYVPVGDSKRAVALLPNAKLEVVQMGRHGMHFQQPENLLKIIKQF